MKAIERLIQYIDYKGFNNRTFEIYNKLSNGYISTQLKRYADLGEGVLIKILNNCLDLSPDWLLTGKGFMLKTEDVITVGTNEINYEELYLDAKYTIQVQKKYIQNLEIEIGNKRVAG